MFEIHIIEKYQICKIRTNKGVKNPPPFILILATYTLRANS